MSEHEHEGALEIEKAKRLIATNRRLIHQIASDRAREDEQTAIARYKLRRAQERIRRAATATP